MTEPEIVTSEKAKQLRDEATGGPWRWRNTSEVHLQGARSRIAMAFRRAGMHGAQPLFRDGDGILQDTVKANLYDFPDARLIAAAPALAHTVATEQERTRAAVVRALRSSVEALNYVPARRRLLEHADAIENGADW